MAASKLLSVAQVPLFNKSLNCWDICKKNISQNKLLQLLGCPGKPKRPPPIFISFQTAMRAKVKADNPDKSFGEITRIITEKWKNLPESEKKKLTENYLEKKAQYKIELENYEENSYKFTNKDIKELQSVYEANKRRKKFEKHQKAVQKEHDKPSFAINSYQVFVNLMREKMSGKQTLKELAEQWRNLSQNEKDYYQKLYKEGLEKYKKELEEWEEKMIQQGNYDLVRIGTLKEKLRLKLS